MVFNKTKRIKFSFRELEKLKQEMGFKDMYSFQFRDMLALDAGLQNTSVRYCTTRRVPVFYYKIISKQKYLLGKIKYGI